MIYLNDAYNDSRFFSGIDRDTGFRTRNILCIPLVSRSNNCIGVLQTLNKISGDFTDKDKDLLSSISHYISIALENSKMYEDLKSINNARKKVIDHLAQELRTPVAIIDAGLERISKNMAENKAQNINRTLARCKRSLGRLLSLQEKITDILNHRNSEDKQKIGLLIETAFSLSEEIEADDCGAHRDILESLRWRLESIYRTDQFNQEMIDLNPFLQAICDDGIKTMGERELEITRISQKA